MSAIKNGRTAVMLDKERHLSFNLNALDELQEKTGGFDKLSVFLSGKALFKNLRWLLTLLLNEGAEDGEELLTEKQVGKMIHAGNLTEVKDIVFKAFAKGTRGDKPDSESEDEGDGEKNSESENLRGEE